MKRSEFLKAVSGILALPVVLMAKKGENAPVVEKEDAGEAPSKGMFRAYNGSGRDWAIGSIVEVEGMEANYTHGAFRIIGAPGRGAFMLGIVKSAEILGGDEAVLRRGKWGWVQTRGYATAMVGRFSGFDRLV